jgi:hypothetical protein
VIKAKRLTRWFVAIPCGTHLRPLTYTFADVFDARQALTQVRRRFPTARVERVTTVRED